MRSTYHPNIHHRRRSIRLKGYNYSQPGAYFVTICTWKREFLLGQIVEGEMILNEYGRVVTECWEWLVKRYLHVELDGRVVMPNHTHGIVALSGRGGSRTAPTGRNKSLGRLVGAFKTASSKRINALRGMPGSPVWQRNYYEHIVRSEDALNRIREYIVNNSSLWQFDRENPERIQSSYYENRYGYFEEKIYGKK